MRHLVFSLLLLGCLASCMETSKVAPAVLSLGVVSNVEQLEFGRDLYVTRCTKCHNALRITRYSQSQWAETLPEMTFKSKFTTQQTQAVAAYIQAVLLSSTTTPN